MRHESSDAYTQHLDQIFDKVSRLNITWTGWGLKLYLKFKTTYMEHAALLPAFEFADFQYIFFVHFFINFKALIIPGYPWAT